MICSDILEMPQTPAKNSPPHLFQDWGLSEQLWEIGRALASGSCEQLQRAYRHWTARRGAKLQVLLSAWQREKMSANSWQLWKHPLA